MTSTPKFHLTFARQQENPSHGSIPGDLTESTNVISVSTNYLHNFLEPYEVFIHKLVKSLQSEGNSSRLTGVLIPEVVLDIVSHISGAEFAFLIRYTEAEEWQILSHSHLSKYNHSGTDLSNFSDDLKNQFLSTIHAEVIFDPACHGTYKFYEQGREYRAFAVIPMQSQVEAIVVGGLPVDSHFLTDIYGRIIASFYQAAVNFTSASIFGLEQNLSPVNLANLVEAQILDDLKSNLGFVSPSLYQRRFELFCDRLRQMVVYFEPVLHLDPNDLFICGWEALARNPESLCAPFELFHAAELWGSRFIVELDQHFLKVATSSYRQSRPPKQRRASDMVPLSVNVYPESLMHPEYFQTLHKIIHEGVITPRNLILEISEKTELPQFIDGIKLHNPLQAFKNRLLEFVRTFNIRFAIDDFGVGHASVSRLAGLNASHIKIDREILFHQPSPIIIKFVHELAAANTLSPARVIVEGVDETSPFSLNLLRKMGVTYIQGHLVGKPEPEIYRLSQEKYLELQKRLFSE